MTRLLRRNAMEVYTEEMDAESTGNWSQRSDAVDFYITLHRDKSEKCGSCFFHNDKKDLCMKHDCYNCLSDDQACIDMKDRSWGCAICGQVIRYNQKSEDYPECESGAGFKAHTNCKNILKRQAEWHKRKDVIEIEERNAEYQKKLGESSWR